jgi:branched-chain amino acid transport system permease protein
MRLSRSSVIGLAALILVPLAVRFVFPAAEKYYLHLLIQILIWSFIYTGWSLMGRFGLTSLGHGAFTGIGAYVMVLLWNFAGITPWLGIPVAIVVSVVVALLVGYPCFHLRIVGHYFALLTLALTEFVRLCIVGLRDFTGGSLGTQPACCPTTLRYCSGWSASTSGGASTAAWTATRSTPRARTRTRPPRSAST